VGRSLDHLIGELIDAGSREHYADADLYDYEYRRRRADVAFYRGLAGRLAGAPGQVLDLGCGSGRLTLALARDGHQVVGVDQSPAMLAGLAGRLQRAPTAVRSRVEAVTGDLRDFDLGRRFPLVVAAFNVVEHLYTRPEITAWLGQVARHLTPGGHLAFDVQMPDLAWLLRDSSKRWARTRFTHPRTGEKLFYSTNHDYDPVSQIAVIRIYYEPVEGGRRSADGRGRTRVVKLTQRKFFPAELETLLWASGFQLVERYGDFQGGPLDGNAESQVVVCRPRPASSPTRIGGRPGLGQPAAATPPDGGGGRRRRSSTRKDSLPTSAPTRPRRRMNVRPTK
jgi:SAM-dependent methyltransferase